MATLTIREIITELRRLAFETSIVFLVPCFLAVGLDVITAWSLGRRVHQKYPNQSDGKFKSIHKFKILYTMIIIFLCNLSFPDLG